MLYNDKACKLLMQKVGFMQEQIYKEFMSGSYPSIIASMQEIFKRDVEIREKFAYEAFQALVRAEIIAPEDTEGRQHELAMYGVAMSGAFLIYNCANDEIELHTSSYQLLNAFASNGTLIKKKDALPIELSKFKDVLTGAKIRKSIKEGMKLVSVRLEPHIVGSSTMFKGQVPKSPINLNECFIVPYTVVDRCMNLVTSHLQTNLVEVAQGDKVRVITKDLGVLRSVYGEERARKLVNFPYNPLTNSLYVPSVGASIHTAGVTNLNLFNVDYIKPTSLATVDLSDVSVDLTLAQGFYERAVRKLKQAELHKLADYLEIDTTGDSTPIVRYKCLDIEKYDKDYYMILKNNKDIFNLDDFKSLPNKIGSLNEDVAIPLNREELTDLFKTGVFKVVITRRTGQLSSMIVTNSQKELARILGRNYLGKYEILRVRADRVRGIMNKYKGDIVKQSDIAKLENIYKLDIPVDADIPKIALLEFLNAKEEMVEQRKTVVNNPEYVRVRNCVARLDKDGKPKDFYKQIDLRSVVSITRLSSVK